MHLGHRAGLIALGLLVACGGKAPPPKPVARPVVVEAPKPPPPPPPKPLSLDERLAAHDRCLAEFFAEVPESFTRCFSVSSTVEWVDADRPRAESTPAIAALMRPLWESFTLEGETRMVLAGPEQVLTIALYRGTHDGKEWMGVSAARRVFGVFVAEVMTLDDQGRHGDVRHYLDLGGMLAQLGGGAKGVAFRKPYDKTGREAYKEVATGSETETANVATVTALFEAFNQHQWKAVIGHYLPNAAISDQIAPADTEGRDITRRYNELGKGFPDIRQEVSSIWAAGDFVVAEATFTGTNTGPAPWLGLKKATKKPVSLRRAHVFRLEGGKVLQHWIFANGLALQAQLGLAPPAATAASAPPAS